MTESKSPSSTLNEGKQKVLTTILNRLSANYILGIIIILLISLTIISIVALRGGGEINIFGLTVSSTSKFSSDTTGVVTDMHVIPTNTYVTIEEFSIISSNYFKADMNRNDIISEIKNLVALSEEMESYKNQFSFKLVKLEREIHSFGRYIDTKIEDEIRQDAYKQIQAVLIEIDYYNGPVDGHQPTTFQTLVEFQKRYNESVNDTIFIPEDFGIFGYRTLEAIRSTYRLRNR